MAQVISQGACPQCSSSDAYTEYDDGGFHCFSCGKHRDGNAYKKLLRGATVSQKKSKLSSCPPLPEDAAELLYISWSLPARGWVASYGITEAEVEGHGFLWSKEKQYLIFPVYDPRGNLVMWQARYFGDNPRHPKYITRGFKEDVLHVIGKPDRSFHTPDKYKKTEPWPDDGTIVLVEDLISAIKVSRVTPAMPLWGSSLSQQNAHRLSLEYSSAYLWLDYDKREEAVRQAIRHSLILSIRPIITKLDPKGYSTEDIREWLPDRPECS